jgi:hypothetical protein
MTYKAKRPRGHRVPGKGTGERLVLSTVDKTTIMAAHKVVAPRPIDRMIGPVEAAER